MAEKKFLLYRVYYLNKIAYIGRTSQPLQTRLHGHLFKAPMMRTFNIDLISKIEFAELTSEADMFLYEIYYINKWKPALNVDDKAHDELSIILPELTWQEFATPLMAKWKEQLAERDAEQKKHKNEKEDLRKKRSQLRKDFKVGKITEDEYYDALEQLEMQIQENEENCIW